MSGPQMSANGGLSLDINTLCEPGLRSIADTLKDWITSL